MYKCVTKAFLFFKEKTFKKLRIEHLNGEFNSYAFPLNVQAVKEPKGCEYWNGQP